MANVEKRASTVGLIPNHQIAQPRKAHDVFDGNPVGKILGTQFPLPNLHTLLLIDYLYYDF